MEVSPDYTVAHCETETFLPFSADFSFSLVSISFDLVAAHTRCLRRQVRLNLARYRDCCAASLGVAVGREPGRTWTCPPCSCSGRAPCPRSAGSYSRSSPASGSGSCPSSARFEACRTALSPVQPAQTQLSPCSTLPDSCPCCKSDQGSAPSERHTLGFSVASLGRSVRTWSSRSPWRWPPPCLGPSLSRRFCGSPPFGFGSSALILWTFSVLGTCLTQSLRRGEASVGSRWSGSRACATFSRSSTSFSTRCKTARSPSPRRRTPRGPRSHGHLDSEWAGGRISPPHCLSAGHIGCGTGQMPCPRWSTRSRDTQAAWSSPCCTEMKAPGYSWGLVEVVVDDEKASFSATTPLLESPVSLTLKMWKLGLFKLFSSLMKASFLSSLHRTFNLWKENH